MLKNNISTETKNYFEQKIKEKIKNIIKINSENFKISLELCGAINTEGHLNLNKISYYGEHFANKMYEKIINEDIDINCFMKTAINYYDKHDEISLITLISIYNDFIKRILPYDIIQFAVNSDIWHCFSETFTKVYKNKLATIGF